MASENNTNAKVIGALTIGGGLAALWYLFFKPEAKKSKLSGPGVGVSNRYFDITFKQHGTEKKVQWVTNTGTKADAEGIVYLAYGSGAPGGAAKLVSITGPKKGDSYLPIGVRISNPALKGTGTYQVAEIGKRHFVIYKFSDGEVMIMSDPYKSKLGADQAMKRIKKQAGQ